LAKAHHNNRDITTPHIEKNYETHYKSTRDKVPAWQKVVESMLFPPNLNRKNLCDVESTWKTNWICKKLSTSGHYVFSPMTW
jgi:hypothetical protein